MASMAKIKITFEMPNLSWEDAGLSWSWMRVNINRRKVSNQLIGITNYLSIRN